MSRVCPQLTMAGDHAHCSNLNCSPIDGCALGHYVPERVPHKPMLYGTEVRKGLSATNDLEPAASAWDVLVPVLCLVMSGGAFVMAAIALRMACTL